MVLVTERFDHLAKTILQSQNISLSAEVYIPGNPELVTEEELVKLAQDIIEQIVEKLTAATTSK